MADNNPTATAASNAEYAAANPNAFGGAQVPTKAPPAPTATPPQTPVSIIGTGSATNTLQNTMIPAMQTASQNLATQNAKVAAQNSGQQVDGSGKPFAFGSTTTPTTQNSGNTGVNNGSTTQTTQTPETTPGTPEYQLLNTPEAGYHFEYAPDGTRTQVINGTNQTGYSLTAPTPITATDTITQSNGTSIKQMSNGTYASYNAAGTYQGPATQQQFNDATTANDLSTKIAQLANGTYPLSPAEEAQVNALKASFQQLIAQQQTANANFTGGVTSAENLYGMGTSISGLGEIKGSIDSGLQKIADLNGKMASAVAQMEEGFKTDDMALFKGAYDVLTSAQKDRQSAIDKIKSDADAAAKDMRDYNLQLKTQKDQEVKDTFDMTMASSQFDEQKKTEAFNEYMQQANLDEKKKQDAVDTYYKGISASHEAASLKIQQEQADIALGKLQQTQNTDVNSVVGAVTTLPSGNKFIDGTGLTADQKSLAMQNGQIVLEGPKLQTMTGLTNIQEQFGSFLSAMQGAGVLNENLQFTMTPGQMLPNKGATGGFAHTWTAGNATDALRGFNNSIFGTDDGKTIKSGSILSDLTKLPNSGDLVASIKNNAINPKDDAKTMQNKIAAITNLLANTETSILNNGVNSGSKVINYDGKNYTVDANGNMTLQ